MYGATAYEADRRNVDGSWTTLSASIDPTATSYADTGLTPGTQYTYRIEALDATGSSASTANQTTLTRPDVVSNFTATVVNGNSDRSELVAGHRRTGYRVMRDDGDGYTQIATPTSTSYQDTGLDENTLYSYKIIAYNASGDGVATAPQDVTTYLNTPDLAFTGYITSTSVTLHLDQPLLGRHRLPARTADRRQPVDRRERRRRR